MFVAEIWRYPVKSMAGEALDEAEVGPSGIPGDRVVQVFNGHGASRYCSHASRAARAPRDARSIR